MSEKEELISQPLLEEAARRFSLLSEPVRLSILNQLHVHGEMNVQALVENTGHGQANVSKHLQLLAGEGMVSRRKEGLYVYYKISDPTLSAICMLVCGRLRDEQRKR